MTCKNQGINNEKKIKIAFLITRCTESGPIELVYNIVLNLERKYFEPHIVTLYPENASSIVGKFEKLGIQCYCAELNKTSILIGKIENLRAIIHRINPDIIHSHGVFPDYVACFFKNIKHIITLHCFMREDYVSEYGWLFGRALEAIQMRAVKTADKTVACSQSLAKKYYDKYRLRLSYVLNGIDFSRFYSLTDYGEKRRLRDKLRLPCDKTIFIYAARFIKRKNQGFLCEAFGKLSDKELLILIGKGPNYDALKKRYGKSNNILFLGYKENLVDYLAVSDVYVSSSKSEGMPAGVMEALACGLPVVLSDIPQHKEILDLCPGTGAYYIADDIDNCVEKIKQMCSGLYEFDDIRGTAFELFDASTMSRKYQEEYMSLVLNGG